MVLGTDSAVDAGKVGVISSGTAVTCVRVEVRTEVVWSD
jgi:hypothetical protein